MTITDVYNGLFTHLDLTNSTIITPNRRLAVTLQSLNAKQQLAANHSAWLTPDILPLNTWLERTWKNQIPTSDSALPLLLNQTQEQQLWENIILTTLEQHPLLQVTETAEIANSAWSLLQQWQVDTSQSSFESQSDYHYFKQWCQTFENICQQNNWLASSQLYEKLAAANLSFAKHIIFVGFTEFSPALNTLIASCEASGSRVTKHCLPAHLASCKVLAVDESEDEIIAMALWAKKNFAENPLQRIGCVIPTLSQQRDRIKQIFSEVFADTKVDINISAGKALLEYPIVQTALQLLAINNDKLTTEQLNLLLTSPFIAYADKERDQRSQIARNMCEKNIHSLKANELGQCFARAPKLLEHLNAFISLIENHKQQHYFSWAAHFNALLATIGWPGEKTLNSEEYQVVEHWLQLLDHLSSLDYTQNMTTFSQALFTLKKMAANHIFQPQSPESSINVLGLLEAAGSPFDKMWVSGMNESIWPPQPKPNPLIPKQIQRELRMPHASADRELQYCQLITEQFQQLSDELIFSYAKMVDELETNLSPILKSIPVTTLEQLALPHYLDPTINIFASREFEKINDEIASPLIHEGHLQGGIDVIKQQALCPFKAFAKHRLHIKQDETIQLGLRPKERGVILHAALDEIWLTLKSHDTLLNYPEVELQALIARAIENAFNKSANSIKDNPTLTSMEKNRFQQLIFSWLALEKERPPFVVHAQEEKMSLTLNSMTLDLRVDRIDKLSNNQYLIIDYKTGKKNSVHSWFNHRPEDPQLPLYAMIDANNTFGIAFAQVNTLDSKYIGISKDETDIAGIKSFEKIKNITATTWQQQIEQWSLTFNQLCDDYVLGKAYVDPKNLHETCEQCDFHSLCRISEARVQES